MILTSNLVFIGLLYYHHRRGSGVQTIRPGRTRPVSHLLDGVMLTGCFLFLTLFIIFL